MHKIVTSLQAQPKSTMYLNIQKNHFVYQTSNAPLHMAVWCTIIVGIALIELGISDKPISIPDYLEQIYRSQMLPVPALLIGLFFSLRYLSFRRLEINRDSKRISLHKISLFNNQVSYYSLSNAQAIHKPAPAWLINKSTYIQMNGYIVPINYPGSGYGTTEAIQKLAQFSKLPLIEE